MPIALRDSPILLEVYGNPSPLPGAIGSFEPRSQTTPAHRLRNQRKFTHPADRDEKRTLSSAHACRQPRASIVNASPTPFCLRTTLLFRQSTLLRAAGPLRRSAYLRSRQDATEHLSKFLEAVLKISRLRSESLARDDEIARARQSRSIASEKSGADRPRDSGRRGWRPFHDRFRAHLVHILAARA
jgi:hypothetical protein